MTGKPQGPNDKTVAQILTDGRVAYLDYDFNARKKRRNGIPFDVEIAKENLLLLKSMFDRHGIRFWLLFGTCLGAVRDGAFIPHDVDTDVGIFVDDKERLVGTLPDLMDQGFEPIRTKHPDDLLTLMRKDEYIDIGIFSRGIDDEGHPFWRYQKNSVYGDHFDRFDTIRFLGTDFLIPQHIERLLEIYYGSGWRTPVRDLPAKELSSFRSFEAFSNLIDLRDFFRGIGTYAVLKLPEHFPNYYDYDDIDILCEDLDGLTRHILAAGQRYTATGFKIEVTNDGEHRHIDFFAPGASRLNFRFDLLGSLDGCYHKFIVDPHYHREILATRLEIVHNGVPIFVPKPDHDLAIRFLEYIEWIKERPSKVKHLEYVQRSGNVSFIDEINGHTNLDMSIDSSRGTIDLKFRPEITRESFTVSKSRMDYFLIWGHGIPHTGRIMEILRNDKKLEIITIVRRTVTNLPQFVQDVYACDSVPFHHLQDKTRYLVSVNPEIIFILVRNGDAREQYYGEGPFRHIQCRHIKEVKEEIRNRFNPRVGGKRTEHHVIHASDYESQVEHVLSVLGLPPLASYVAEAHDTLHAPYHLGPLGTYKVQEVPIDCLRASILGRGLVPVTETPHYRYASGDREDYLLYHRMHWGTELTDDHFPEAFDAMILNFKYGENTPSGKRNLVITTALPDGSYRIMDGVHRAAILKSRGADTITIAVVSPEEQDSDTLQQPAKDQTAFIHSVAQEFEERFSRNWLQENFQDRYDVIRDSVDAFMCSGTRSIGRVQTLDEFFQGEESLWQQFVDQVIDKNCLEIGSGPCGIASYWHFIRKWHVIDPLVEKYKRMTMEMFGKTWWWHWIKMYPLAAESYFPELEGKIDGTIFCRNALDHADEPIEVLNNIARYAAPGCLLLLWTDIYHLNGHDEGHRNICRSPEMFRNMITNRGFSISYETPMFRKGETVEFGCVAVKTRS